MVQNELELQDRQKQMIAGLKGQHKVDKIVTQKKWTNQYGELVPLPEL
jgi:hypothetical protein